MYSLTVIVPFYNEEEFLNESFSRLYASKVANKIFLVDDCSTDRSKEIAQKIAESSENVFYYLNNQNKGKGAAIKTVARFIETTHVAIHDADLEYDPKDLLNLKKISVMNKKSLIIGSRFIGNLKRNNLYSSTFIANKLFSLLFSIINYYKITDIATCYKIFPADFIKKTEFKENGFSIEVEIVSKYLKYYRSVLEVPISYSGRSYLQGKKINYKDGFFYFFNIFKYKLF